MVNLVDKIPKLVHHDQDSYHLTLELDSVAAEVLQKRASMLWYITQVLLKIVVFTRSKWRLLHQPPTRTVKHDARLLKVFIRHCKALPPREVLVPHPDKPVDVSIVIPVYNQWHLTRACLNSILQTCDGQINYEIILADDSSTDDTKIAGIEYRGLQVVQTSKNVGFLRNCNQAVKKAQGRYILLLNNDTIVLPNWLSSLYSTLENDPTAAIVGSKMLSSEGLIVEAGVSLFRDGTDCHQGQGVDRYTPMFNLMREVDCISGCSILIRKTFWEEVGGFYERYENGYFEDYDLAMEARSKGMRVIYQPQSEIVHFEHQTYSAKVKNAHVLLSNHNKSLFLEKWSYQLISQHCGPVPQHIAMSVAERTPSLKALQRRAQGHLNILFFSPDPPYPNNHGNRVRMCRLVKKFQELGHTVHFALLECKECTQPNLTLMREKLNTSLDVIPYQKLRVSPGAVPFDGWYERGIGEKIRLLCDQYDVDVVLCSYVYHSKLLEFVPQHILKVLDTHDIMANRTEMLRLNQLPIGQFSCSTTEEGAYLRRADCVIGITNAESRYFDVISGQKKALTISHIEAPRFIQKQPSKIQNIGIIASNNRFNIAMVQQFLQSLQGHLSSVTDCPFTVHIVGEVKKGVALRSFLRKMHVFKSPWVKMHGFVEDLSPIYHQMDLIVSPMLCGTGINIKTVEAMAYGMPVLSTRHGVRGIETSDPMHHHATLDDLVISLFELLNKPFELKRLAQLSRDIYLDFYQKTEEGLRRLFNHPKLDAPENYKKKTSLACNKL